MNSTGVKRGKSMISEPSPTRVYLAARYSRREEMLGYAKELEAAGYVITSRWITGCHEIPGRREDATTGKSAYTVAERAHFAEEDLKDLEAASVCISFTEPQKSTANRGGRHVEFGVALATKKFLVIVGEHENVFHCLPSVEQFDTFKECMDWLTP
jgi:hypothetical protein